MPCSELWLKPADFIRGVERSPDEVLNTFLTSDLEDPNPPVELCFLANSKTVEVYERYVDVLEGRMESGFVVAVAGDDGYVWEGGEGEDGWGGGGAG